MKIQDIWGKRLVFFDGAMGTMLQQAGLKAGDLPEKWNFDHPEVVTDIHSRYLRAGCDILKTNTFGANRLKLAGAGHTAAETVRKGVLLARQAEKRGGRQAFVAVDIGPTGKLLRPLGDLEFEEAVSIFSEMIKAGAEAGADCVLLETFSDTYEVKAAMLAAKESCDLPVYVTLMFDGGGKLLNGADALTAMTMLEALGADAVGFNCGFGPEQAKTLFSDLREATDLPLICNPNAGLPQYVDGGTRFELEPGPFAMSMQQLAVMGVWAIGGCCGTTPDHIAAMTELCREIKPQPIRSIERTAVTSFNRTIVMDGERTVLIGERINPTGKKRFKQALREQDMDYILQEGFDQLENGAHILDVNVGLPEIDEVQTLKTAVQELQAVISLPLQIDTSNTEALEQALRIYNGKPMVNSVNGKRESLETVLPLVKKYGGLVVALTLDEQGIPQTVDGRVKIARRIVETASAYGISKKDIVVDVLTMAVSTGADAALITLESLGRVKKELGVKTVLGVSNVSFGLPQRERINASFFTLAMRAGLDAAIINPCSAAMMEAYRIYGAIAGLDSNCADYIACFSTRDDQAKTLSSGKPSNPETDESLSLFEAVVKGRKERAHVAAEELLLEHEPLSIINSSLVPALDEVGRGFEHGTIFLPQLLMSAEAARAGFDVIRERMAVCGRQEEKGQKVILATVKGDIHDIGKNIVKVLLENYGFHVIDLGKDVEPERVVETAVRENVRLVGLSALMTTTVPSMTATIRLLHDKKPDCRVVVGGAVLTQEYADQIGADKYPKDAMVTVHYAQELFADH